MTSSRFRSICVVGADGAGKTTVCRTLADELKYRGDKYEYRWCGWKEFQSLPFRMARELLWQFRRDGAEASANPENNSLNSPGIFRMILGLCYFPFVFLDHFITTVPQALSYSIRDRPVIYDRYYYGLIIGFSAYYSLPDWVTRSLLGLNRLYPSPDVVIYLKVDPDIAFERKEDVPSPEYIQRRCERYELIHTHEGVISVNANQSPKAVESAVIDSLGAHDK